MGGPWRLSVALLLLLAMAAMPQVQGDREDVNTYPETISCDDGGSPQDCILLHIPGV